MAILCPLEGVVLKKYTLLEMTQSVTMFTQKKGKIHLIVKGAQKITSRRSPHLQTGNLVSLDTSLARNGAWYVRSTKLVSGFSALKESQERVRVLYNMLLVLDRLLPLEQPDQMVYARLIRAMIHLNSQTHEVDRILLTFVSELFELLGYGKEQFESYDEMTDKLSELAEERIKLMS